MHELPINTDTINKSIDIIDETTKETRKELDKISAKGVHKLSQLFWASPLGIKADVYIQERPYKLKKALEEMQVKYDLIPTDIGFKLIQDKYINPGPFRLGLTYKKALLMITDFGKNFIDICLS